MAFSSSIWATFFILGLQLSLVVGDPKCGPVEGNDTDRILFALNLEFLEVELFCIGATGVGLDYFDPTLAQGGPPPTGAKLANLDFLVRRIIEEFGYQEIGHIRAIVAREGGFPRPLLNLSSQNFANTMDKAFGYNLVPPFDPYANSVNYLLASYLIPYVGLNGYVGTIPDLQNYTSKSLVASLLGVESGQDAVLRTLLYERGSEYVHPYPISVADFTERLSELRTNLGMCGVKGAGVTVPFYLGAENRTSSHVLAADASSLSYARTPREILRIVYGSGSESIPGGFYPAGANGNIATSFLRPGE